MHSQILQNKYRVFLNFNDAKKFDFLKVNDVRRDVSTISHYFEEFYQFYTCDLDIAVLATIHKSIKNTRLHTKQYLQKHSRIS